MKLLLRTLTLGSVLATAAAFGQVVRVDKQAPGYGSDVFHGPYYATSTQTTFWAKVKGISKTPARTAGQATDVSLLVLPFKIGHDKNDEPVYIYGDYETVELGPDWYVSAQDTKLHINDYVQITGSRMEFGGQKMVLAQSVRRQHEILSLRRDSGEPYWYAFAPKPQPTVKQPDTPIGNTVTPPDTMPPADNGGWTQQSPNLYVPTGSLYQLAPNLFIQTGWALQGPPLVFNPGWVRF